MVASIQALQQGITPGKTLMSFDVEVFQQLTGTPKSNEVPELLIVMTTIGLLNRALPLEETLIAVIGQDWEFEKAISIEDTIYAAYTVEAIKEAQTGNRQKAMLAIEVYNQEKKHVVARGKWEILISNK